MANKHKKGYSTLLVTAEVQNKTTIRFHYIPIRNIETPNVGWDDELELLCTANGRKNWYTTTLEKAWHCHLELNICTKRQEYS